MEDPNPGQEHRVGSAAAKRLELCTGSYTGYDSSKGPDYPDYPSDLAYPLPQASTDRSGGNPVAAVDSRRVQTAVIGGPDSDQPVIAPEQPHHLDELRRHFGTDQFWCGTHLGGCGEKLMTKRYEWKVCHFSHYPDRDGSKPTCHRSATGVESADHLFIKRDVKAWLADQGYLAQADLRSLGHDPGDAVDFWLCPTGQHLRFALHPGDYRTWRRAVESLGAKTGRVEWVFGRDGAVVTDTVARRGYALRVRCETQGTDRRVLIGVVTANTGTVPWAPL
ncbi:competence protein CoiA family protein [Kitasatospora sp. NPDC093558]|uniref:competence protein CoiA family protein n=1 Tax=Kitasatospora sp. NPDC093558 TaxID=3155201 RepID=UPI003418D123